MTVQIFVYKFLFTNFCLQLCFLEKGKTTLVKPFTFWKWKHILKKKKILKMKAHSKTHFENENMFSEKGKKLKKPFTFWKWKHILKNNHVLKMKAPEVCSFSSCDARQKKKKILFLQSHFYCVCMRDRHNKVFVCCQNSQNLSHFENENTFRKRTTFWKWKLIPKRILKMKTCFRKSEK